MKSPTPPPVKVACDGLGLCFKISFNLSGYNLKEVFSKESVCQSFSSYQICPYTPQSGLLEIPNLLYNH